MGGAARAAGGLQGGARRLQRAAALGRGPAAGQVGQQPAGAQEGAGPRRPQRRDDAGWEAQLAKLKAYKRKHGDCNVPKGWAEDPRFASWVFHQRRSKKKLDRGEPREGMTAERAAKLEALGLVWDQREAEREAQLARLTAYKAAHGDCNVPRDWAEDPRLASWVDTQRRLKRLTLESSEASPRVRAEWAQLTALGFTWHIVQTGGT